MRVPVLSLVVPATDTPPTLDRCRAAIDAANDPPEEIVIVDGPGHLSASAARNVGVARSSGDVVVFVDADVEVHPDVFTRIRDAFDAAPELTAVFGSYDDRPHVPSTVSAFRNLLHHHVHHAGAGEAETFWTGLGAVRREAFLAVDGFDEDRFPHPSIEDIELGERLRARGGRILLDPAIQGTHLKHWTLRSMLWTDFARRGVPWVSLQVRNRRLAGTLNCGWRHRASALAIATGMVGIVVGLPLVVVPVAGTLLGLNHRFYSLLARRLGPARAVAGIGLHALHHVVAIAAVGAGVLALGFPDGGRRLRSERAPARVATEASS